MSIFNLNRLGITLADVDALLQLNGTSLEYVLAKLSTAKKENLSDLEKAEKMATNEELDILSRYSAAMAKAQQQLKKETDALKSKQAVIPQLKQKVREIDKVISKFS
jgi:hypothetical protein